jgi:spermidine synthase
MGAEILVILSFQVVYGYIYLKIGAIITAFLLGLLPGAITGRFFTKAKGYPLLISESFFLLLLALFYFWVSLIRGEPTEILFLVYGFIFSFFCGFQFPLAVDLIGEKNSPVAGCLAADLTGAALGILLIGSLIIPLLGIQAAVFFLVLVKISSGMIIFIRKR